MSKLSNLKEKFRKSMEEYLLKKVDNDKVNKELEKAKAAYEGVEELTVEQEAILFAQCIEKQSLKSPSQAVFPDFSEFEVSKNADGIYTVSGYVDAPNSYGALTRGKFSFLMKNKNGRWEYAVSEGEIKTTMIGTAVVSIIILAALFSFISYVALMLSF